MTPLSDRDDSLSDLRAFVERAASALLERGTEVPGGPVSVGCSPKEVLGLLIDAASNTHRRLLWAWEHESLAFDGYVEEAYSYEEADWSSLVTLWWMVATHLLRTMESIPDDVRRRPHRHHALAGLAGRPVPADQPATLDDLVQDFGAHLRHHLARLFPEDQLLSEAPGSVPSSQKHR